MTAWNDYSPVDDSLVVDGVEVTYYAGPWEIWCSWPHRGGRHEVVTLMRITYNGIGPALVQSTTRINILSASAVDKVIAAMSRKIESRADAYCAEIIHNVCEDLMHWYRQGKSISKPDPSQQREKPGWIAYPIWPATGATAVTAAPGSYKSLIAQALGIQVATSTVLLHRNTKTRQPRRVIYLDWEADEQTFAERMGAICRGGGLELQPYLGYKQMTARLADVAIGLAEEIRSEGYEAVVIDSMSASIGGGMVDDDSVNGFWDGVRTLGTPSLVLAHKSAENIARRRKRFFGSIMSEARVRMAWNAEKADATNHVVWECFKDNNTGHFNDRLAWEVEILNEGDEDEATLSKVGFTGINPNNVVLSAETQRTEDTVADQIEALLEAAGTLSVGEISQRLRKSTSNVRAQLSRHTDRFVKDSVDRWSLLDAYEPEPML